MLTRLIATQREIDRVIVQVAAAFGCTPAQLKGPSHADAVTLPRHLAIYIAAWRTGASSPTLGRAFGGRHHTTVLHSLKRIELLRETDPGIRAYVAIALAKPPAEVETVAESPQSPSAQQIRSINERLVAAKEAIAAVEVLVADLPR